MGLREKRCRFSYLLALLIQHAFENGYELYIGDVFARDGHCQDSFHYKGLAADLNLFQDGKYLTRTEDHAFLGEYWEWLDPMCTWGGRFSDGNHYSYGEGK